MRLVNTPISLGPVAAEGAARGWMPPVPATGDAWRTRCAEVAREHPDWLTPLRAAFGGGKGAALLDRVADGRGVVVTTGQQAGLFGGPLYTWHKALAALELARAIERECGVPAVPVFWAATDDADFSEAASTAIPTSAGAQRLSLTVRPADGVPTSFAPLTAEVDRLAESLRAAAGSAPDPRALDAAAAFTSGATLGGAYLAMLRQLLEPLGVAVLDASHPAVFDASRNVLERAMVRGAGIVDALRAQRDALRATGADVSVDVSRPLTMVFAWDIGRDGLPVKRRVALDEVASELPRTTRRSANVLLRPVVERAILPTVAYVAGAGELAYFAQASVVADAMGAARPLGVPRWSGYAIPDDIDASLARLAVSVDELRDPHAAEGRLARAALSSDVADALGQLRGALERHLARLDGAAPERVVSGARDQLARRVSRLERRIVAHAKRRDNAALRAIAAARGTLFPFGVPQERSLNVVPLWSRFGDEWVSSVRAACAVHAAQLVPPSRVSV